MDRFVGKAGWSSPPPFCESKTGNKKGFRATEMSLRWWRGMEQPAAVLRKQNGKQKRLPGDRKVASLVARDGAAR
jgi:hypothetical protein